MAAVVERLLLLLELLLGHDDSEFVIGLLFLQLLLERERVFGARADSGLLELDLLREVVNLELPGLVALLRDGPVEIRDEPFQEEIVVLAGAVDVLGLLFGQRVEQLHDRVLHRRVEALQGGGRLARLLRACVHQGLDRVVVLREDVSQARAVEIAGLADVLVVFRQVLAEDQVRREVVDALLRLGRAALAWLGLRRRGGEVDLVVDGVAGLVQFGVERVHVAVHEVALRD